MIGKWFSTRQHALDIAKDELDIIKRSIAADERLVANMAKSVEQIEGEIVVKRRQQRVAEAELWRLENELGASVPVDAILSDPLFKLRYL